LIFSDFDHVELIAAEVVLDDRAFTTIDEAEVLTKANELFLRVLNRVRG
jgi:hypothetical protein